MFCRAVGRCQAAEQRRACRCPSTRSLAALLVARRFLAGALQAPLEWRSVDVTSGLSVLPASLTSPDIM